MGSIKASRQDPCGTLPAAVFTYKIAIVGNPVVPDARFDDAQMRALKELGFNTVQLNIAWGSRPPGEALNLEDVLGPVDHEPAEVLARRAELVRRARQCKRHGFRTIFHFGAPFVGGLYTLLGGPFEKNQVVGACIELDEVVARYGALVERLAVLCPEIDDILVYTYDQEAWICSEFSTCPRCQGKPLHERLPRFLKSLRDGWAKYRPGGLVWWEPWELSAGQVFAVLPGLPRNHFGLMLHSNIAEVQMTRPVDMWFRNTARMAVRLGLPVAGELFLCSANEEVGPLQHVVAPQLVWSQLAALASVPDIAGVKEYFGTRPDIHDPNLAMAGLVFADPQIPLQTALEKLAQPHGPSKPDILAAWQAAADGLELFPWDVSWRMRGIDRNRIGHDWKAFTIPGHVADSPSWLSTRRALFMITENEDLHPWFLEDFSLRCQMAAACFEQAVACYGRALAESPGPLNGDVILWKEDMEVLMRVARAYALHSRETLVASHLREALKGPDGLLSPLLGIMRELLRQDAENQSGEPVCEKSPVPSARQMLGEFDRDPARWLQAHLL